MDAALFDLDGTVTSCEWRRHHVTRSKPNWPAFFAGMNADAPVPIVVGLLHALRPGVARLLVSARPDNYRYHTEWWLAEHGITYDRLLMRKAGDFRPDPIVKAEILARITAAGFTVRLVVDDRPPVVAMWRSHGLHVIHVTDPGLAPVKGA